MSNNHIFRYVIFGLGLFYTCATFDKNKARCKDCTGYNKERCPIEGDSGYYVAISSRKLKSMKDTSKGNPLTDDLDVCIPSSMNVDGIEMLPAGLFNISASGHQNLVVNLYFLSPTRQRTVQFAERVFMLLRTLGNILPHSH
ncbi:uncharacterized protein LOC128257400 isoform X4 [Drosophila gunungcola]|uniref:uncharacterized protein LOC128257400 isoform X4 n=1 Tax=Drosophila gunungcola TaxID=103775 RepID=UPI0022E1E0C0|nr:uncharacterized protein LOC128257400 isoform X4 [Drosophila gunungcola]